MNWVLVLKTYGGRSYSKKEIDDMIAAADKNADGKVDYEGTVRGLQLREKKKENKRNSAPVSAVLNKSYAKHWT